MVVDTFWLATGGRPRRTVAWANSLVVGSTFLLRVDAPAAGGWESAPAPGRGVPLGGLRPGVRGPVLGVG